MQEILADVECWIAQHESIAIATVIQTWGSSPRQIGAKLAITASGHISGSVSGGCVEAAVIETAFDVIKTGEPQLLHFGVANDTAWDVGLACGGTIEIFVKPFDAAHFDFIRMAMRAARPVVIATVITGPKDTIGRAITIDNAGCVVGSLGAELDVLVLDSMHESMRRGQSRRVSLPSNPPVEVFLDVINPALEVIMVGGVHIAIALTKLAKTMGYRTTVIDPRAVFGSEQRFPTVDRLIHAWPAEALTQIGLSPLCAVVVLTHDPKLDDPALTVALLGPAFYVGALGSTATQQRRRERLSAAGITASDLARLHGPIGIDLGGQTPEEIALAIMSEIVAVRHGRVLQPAVHVDPVAHL